MAKLAKRRPIAPSVTSDPSAANGRGAAYSGVGADLRAARLRGGLELADVAERLNIKRSNLEAIEEGRFGALPGPAYTSGFLRSYATFLGMDGEAALRQLREEVDAPKPGPLVFPLPTSEGRMPGGRTILIGLLAAAAIYVFWSGTLRDGDKQQSSTVAPVPDRLAPLIQAEAPPPPPLPSEDKTEPPKAEVVEAVQPAAEPPKPVVEDPPKPAVAEAPPAPTPAPIPAPAAVAATAEADVPPEPAATTAVAAAEPEPEPEAPSARLYGATNVDGRVLIVSRMDSWIQVRGKEREIVFSRTLRAGDSFRVPNRADLTFMTGNAGGLEVTVDGKPIPPVGALGAVKRNIPLDPAKLIQGERSE